MSLLTGKKRSASRDNRQAPKRTKHSPQAGTDESDEAIFGSLPGQLQPSSTQSKYLLPNDLAGPSHAHVTREAASLARRQLSDAANSDASAKRRQRSGLVTASESYGVCFGMLCMAATSCEGAKLPTNCTRAVLSFERHIGRLYVGGVVKCLAVLISDVLRRLLAEQKVTLTAILCGKNSKKMAGATFCSVRIVVYGFLRDKDAVGEALADEDLFLQHPVEAELDGDVKYVNPHYLLPAGENMPPIEELSIPPCCAGRTSRSSPATDMLGEYEKGQVLQILDTAYESVGATTTIKPSPRLATNLKRHQIEALSIMIEKETGNYDGGQFPSMWMAAVGPDGRFRYQNILTGKFEMARPPPMGGGILADEMGLGKSLSILSLICYKLDRMDRNMKPSQGHPRASLIVAPKSTIYAWEKQIKTHIQPGRLRWITYYGSRREEVVGHMGLYDVVLTTYDTLASDRTKGGPLFKFEWWRIILDEAHKIRNRSTKIFKDVCAVRSRYRWCLTGTPIQNSLDDFGALLAFIRVYPLETKESFNRFLARPIKEKKREALPTLRRVVAATCLRRTKADHALTLNLTAKTELVEQLEMTREDRELYEFFKHSSHLTTGARNTFIQAPTPNILVLISILRLICNHGESLLPEFALKAWREQDTNSLTWSMLESGIKRCISCACAIEELAGSESGVEELDCGHAFCESCAIKSQGSAGFLSCPECRTAAPESALDDGYLDTLQSLESKAQSPISRVTHYTPSAKVEALLMNITERRTTSRGEVHQKNVVFSYWTKMLDLIGAALNQKDICFRRIDGQSSLSQRKEALDSFGSDPECRVMLASMGAAGEGIDLTAANTVHIVEPHWNPMAEYQAVDRVHRIGQEQDVTVIRYVINNSIESYVQWVQKDKLRLVRESLSTADQDHEKVVKQRWKELLRYLA